MVFPTPVGVFPWFRLCAERIPSLPHARGGVSIRVLKLRSWHLSSPRPWGCFLWQIIQTYISFVFPTPVGVFPDSVISSGACKRLPHARGGVSIKCQREITCSSSSPRPWGCFFFPVQRRFQRPVFPTPVGVFPKGRQGVATLRRLPHARGGVSE